MQYECKITVLETKVFPELQEKYDPADAGLIKYGAPDACSIEDHKSGRKGCCYAWWRG